MFTASRHNTASALKGMLNAKRRQRGQTSLTAFLFAATVFLLL